MHFGGQPLFYASTRRSFVFRDHPQGKQNVPARSQERAYRRSAGRNLYRNRSSRQVGKPHPALEGQSMTCILSIAGSRNLRCGRAIPSKAANPLRRFKIAAARLSRRSGWRHVPRLAFAAAYRAKASFGIQSGKAEKSNSLAAWQIDFKPTNIDHRAFLKSGNFRNLPGPELSGFVRIQSAMTAVRSYITEHPGTAS